jgi:homoserine dehydrogenase
MTISPLRLGIAGLGSVGSSLVKLIEHQQDILEERAGRAIVITQVSARDMGRNRGLHLDNITWQADPLAMAASDDVDAVVELIGGSDGIALNLAKATLSQSKPLITANKAMLAKHGRELAVLAEQYQTHLAFEAAVAGGIPVIKMIREGLTANRTEQVHGILNGTCNYILTTMSKSGADFTDVLKEAQRLGYAEVDPSFDIDGFDTMHKIAILASLAFGVSIHETQIPVMGIRHVTLADIEAAEELGYAVKLLGMARATGAFITCQVTPCLVPFSSPLAYVDGANNALSIRGDFVGQLQLQGAGAGGNPTASAVAADIIDLASGRFTTPWVVPPHALKPVQILALNEQIHSFYIRLSVEDHSGVVAQMASTLAETGISMKTLSQQAGEMGQTQIIITTHPCSQAAMDGAIQSLNTADYIKDSPVVMLVMPGN